MSEQVERASGAQGASEVETREFVRELARDVSPVERIARLRTAALRVLAVWAGVTIVALSLRGLSASLSDPARMMGGFGAVLAGLSLVGAGGLVAALATAVPGREPTARAASGVLGFGLIVALGLGALLLRGDPSAAVPPNLRSDLACLVLASVVALLPSLGALIYVVRAAPPRPVPMLWGIGLGCVGLGAFTAQLSCPDPALRHLLVSHALAPAIGSVVFLVPLWLGYRRLHPA